MAEEVEKDVPKFDWVTKRFSCSLPNVFNTLRKQVEEDVKTRNSLRPENSPYEFSVAEDVGNFTIFLKTQGLQRAVVFNLAEHAIVVRDDKATPMFEITLTFGEDGKCRLNVDGREHDFWQVRRLALEDLLFRSY